MKKLKHFLYGALGLVAVAVPPLVSSAWFRHLLDTHTVWAAYFPVVSGIALAIWRSIATKKGGA